MEIDLTGLVLPEKVETVQLSKGGRVGEFAIEPLERGFGYTLGNSVRRVLLSSLRGAAVWAFQIDGVVHEHQTIPGVVEDVHQVIQNLKSLIVLLDDDLDEVTLEVIADKAGPVTAAHTQVKGGVQVLDPDHILLTLQENRPFRMELRVNKGRGFVLADQHPVGKSEPVDLVRVDSIYNPVRRANFQVLDTRVGQRTDFDQLTFFVETDGSISPENAMAVAAGLICKHLEYLMYFGQGGIPQSTPDGTSAVSEAVRDLLGQRIEDLAGLSVRSRNSLKKENIRNLGGLIEKTESEMLEIENFGKKSLQEIKEFLQEHDLRFAMKVIHGDDGQLFFVDAEAGGGTETGDE